MLKLVLNLRMVLQRKNFPFRKKINDSHTFHTI